MFWKNFNGLCENRNTKPLSVVKELKIASGSITKWKNGSMPKAEALLKIADYFGVSVDCLLGRADKTDNSITVSNVNNSNGNIGHNSNVTIDTQNTLSGMEQDLINIFRSSNGKTQMKIMQYVYKMENEK